ncbi:energy transducer TonB [Snodgrassella sp. CFCC 13594]|uniref:energy transducer TonB n=1 Tax=Snodgrassella sp. CFCC 13594 TaxID=1775559 RepID=UPI00082A3409|nr:energy transducer TonB [Snodgrassella sp. CFCC 13594]
METDHLLRWPTLALVLMLHSLLLWAMWRDQPPKVDLSSASLSFVDLNALPAKGDVPTAAGAPSKPASQKPKTKTQPHPIKPQVKPVVTTQPRAADLAKPTQKAKPVQPTTTTTLTRQTSSTEKSQSNSNSKGATGSSGSGVNNGSPSGTAGGSAAAGGGGNLVIPSEYKGGFLAALRPNYPERARENGEEGNVGIAVSVSASGSPTNVRVAKSSGFPQLDRAAKQAVENYRFKPATRGGTPIPYDYHFTVQFKLKKSA